MRSRRYSIFFGAFLTTWGCAHDTRPVRPDDMTVEQHEATAQQEMKMAQAEEADAYTNAPGESALNASNDPELYLYPQSGNLVQSSLEHAQLLERQARAHEDAAVELASAENAECKAIALPERSTCPVLGSVTQVSNIAGGVRVEFTAPARAAAALPRMRCHLAYAKAHGFSNTPDCALYIRDVDFRPDPDPRALDIVATNSRTMARTTAEIRRRIRATTGR